MGGSDTTTDGRKIGFEITKELCENPGMPDIDALVLASETREKDLDKVIKLLLMRPTISFDKIMKLAKDFEGFLFIDNSTSNNDKEDRITDLAKIIGACRTFKISKTLTSELFKLVERVKTIHDVAFAIITRLDCTENTPQFVFDQVPSEVQPRLFKLIFNFDRLPFDFYIKNFFDFNDRDLFRNIVTKAKPDDAYILLKKYIFVDKKRSISLHLFEVSKIIEAKEITLEESLLLFKWSNSIINKEADGVFDKIIKKVSTKT